MTRHWPTCDGSPSPLTLRQGVSRQIMRVKIVMGPAMATTGRRVGIWRYCSRSAAQAIALVGAIILTIVLLALEFEILELRRHYGTGQRLHVAEIVIVAALLGSCLIAFVVQWRNGQRRHLEPWRQAETGCVEDRAVADRDPMTVPSSRRTFIAALEEAIMRTSAEHATLIVLGFEGLAHINDADGNVTGDAVLREMAHRLHDLARDGDLVCHIGDDTFAILAYPPGDRENGMTVGERFAAAFDDPIRIGGRAHCIDVAVGVALYPENAENAEALVQHAEFAMHLDRAARRSQQHFLEAMSHAPAV